ncbi:TPA: hypothetical protein JK846_003557 [Escherichia coli]|nr:hypothetical protein [Salmonella enterica]HAV7961445.1 hypothetical protein [Escherichia coli]
MPKAVCLVPLYGDLTVNGWQFTPIEGTPHYLSEELPQDAFECFIVGGTSYVAYEEPKAAAPAPEVTPAPAAKKKAPAKAPAKAAKE